MGTSRKDSGLTSHAELHNVDAAFMRAFSCAYTSTEGSVKRAWPAKSQKLDEVNDGIV